MPVNLSIKEVPDALASRLRARAERHHRSLQGELMAIIEQATAEDSEPRAAPQREAAAKVFSSGTKTIEQTAAALLLRFPEPFSDGPMAVDIIRADRDSR
jgi:plasmid stability protein